MRSHLVGVGGSGMRPLAALLCLRGEIVTGSDRAFDRGGGGPARAALEAAGVRIAPQDGSAVRASPPPDRVVVSTAIEPANPDVAAARATGVPVVHRAETLAEIVAAASVSIGVAGTSGKTTTVGMLVAALRGAGRNPTGYAGAAYVGIDAPLGIVAGDRDLFVFEADESDGSIERYAPAVGVVLNAALDHKPIPEIERMLAAFAARARRFVDARAIPLEAYADDAWGSRFEAVIAGRRVPVRLAVPGRHNAANAAAALAATVAAGGDLEAAAAGLAAFRGMRRRLEVVVERDSWCVVDDYAHNPDKVRAAIAAVRARYRRAVVVYQPHGYGPTRFLLEPLAAAFAESLAGGGRLVLLPIYDAGGTAARSVTSADLAAAVASRGGGVEVVPDRAAAIDRVLGFLRAARPAAAVVMGARDETLADLARDIARHLDTG